MTSAVTAAQVFLDLADKEGKRLTNMQLQKLVFFAHGVHLAVFDGAPLISEPVKAWDFGPVIPALYEKLREFGRGEVMLNLAPDTRDHLDPAGSEYQAIRSVWDAYKGYSAWDLSKISHAKGSPWDQVWNDSRNRYGDISNDVIRSYYAGLVRRKESSPVAA